MLRNREFRQFAALFALMAGIVIAVGFALSREAGILSAVSSAAFGAAFFAFTKGRYNRIARISHQIDLVLHNADRLELDEPGEGELSILHSEITKMMLCIREQNEALKREKERLADSLADIAHQIRTPLTSANLILSLLANSSDQQERKAFVRETEELLLGMDWLVTALLNLSRLDAGVVAFQWEPVEVDALVQDALRPFQVPMDLHGIEVQIRIPKGMRIQGDSRWLSQAVQNILKNSLENCGNNGKIEIVGRDNPLFAEISIHDSGPGFDKSELPRLFERFYRGKSANSPGFGIGLALSKTIITRQGGTVTGKNHPRGGAVFSHPLPKVTNLSPKSHRVVSEKRYAMGNTSIRRLMEWSF